MNILNWITTHYVEIVSALTSIIIAARIIVKLTPTPKDDTILEKIITFLKHVGLHIPLIIACMMLASCANNTFLGLDVSAWKSVGVDALKAGAQQAVVSYGTRRQVTSGKEPINVNP